MFGPNPTPWAMRVVPDGDQMRLCGSTEQMAFALRLLQMVDDIAPTLPPPVSWAGAQPLDWPGGKMTGAAFVKRFADTLDANLIGAVANGEVELGAPQKLSPADWFARATAVLHSIGHVVFPVEPAQRVFVLRSKPEVRCREVTWYSAFETSQQVKANPAVRSVVTAWALQHIQARSALDQLLPFAQTRPDLTFSTLSPSRLVIAGMRDDLVPVLEKLQSIDVAK
jgi:hypothetical protein